MKVTTFTVSDKTEVSFSGMPLATNASWWITQCAFQHSGATFFIFVAYPVNFLDIHFALSVHKPIRFDQEMHVLIRKTSIVLKMRSAEVFNSSGLQNINSSITSSG